MFRHLNLPFPTRPDVSIFDDCLGYDILFVNESHKSNASNQKDTLEM